MYGCVRWGVWVCEVGCMGVRWGVWVYEVGCMGVRWGCMGV